MAKRTRKRPETWRATVQRLESEPETNEGRKDLIVGVCCGRMMSRAAEVRCKAHEVLRNLFILIAAASRRFSQRRAGPCCKRNPAPGP